MDRPIRCISLMLEHEEQAIKTRGTTVLALNYFLWLDITLICETLAYFWL
jgi:hypothetical protein